MIAVAVDEAVDAGGLHFSAAGNSGYGWRFTSVRTSVCHLVVVEEWQPRLSRGVCEKRGDFVVDTLLLLLDMDTNPQCDNMVPPNHLRRNLICAPPSRLPAEL